MHVGREEEPGGGDRPQQIVGRACRRVAHPGDGLGQEVLHDHLLDVTVTEVAGGDRAQRVEPVLTALADPDEDPRRERDRQLSRRLERGQPAGRVLVGRAPVALETRR